VSILEINGDIQRRVRAIPGVMNANAVVYGATPLSSIRGTVDLMVSGPDWEELDSIADELERRLQRVGGLSGFERSWNGDARRLQLDVDTAKALSYGLMPAAIAKQVAAQVNGIPGGSLRVPGENGVPVWVRLRADQRSDAAAIAALTLSTPQGTRIPLAQVATVRTVYAPTAFTHQNLERTVDVIGYRRAIAITAVGAHVSEALKGLQLPRGYSISDEGENKEMAVSFVRLLQSLALGIVLLAVVLVISFRSFVSPIAILATLPLAVIGAIWALMIADKHSSMAAFMGMILLMGIVVKNGILLVDFAQEALARGIPLRKAILQAVELRTRPILMTATAAAVGMIPVALEWAVGLERLSPLAVEAIGVDRRNLPHPAGSACPASHAAETTVPRGIACGDRRPCALTNTDVNKHAELTPPRPGRSITYRADRRRVTMLSNSQFSGFWRRALPSWLRSAGVHGGS